jgi:two-component system, OmpR family, sensor kinase
MCTEPATRYATPHSGGREFAEDGSFMVRHRQGPRITSKQLLSVVAHDMRNYLTPMRGRAALLLRRALKEHREADVRDAAALERAIERLYLLVINVVEGARLDAGLFTVHRQKVDLLDLARDSAMMLATETVDVRVETPVRSLAAVVDPERIRQALDNLVANAISHSPEHGVVLIRIARDNQSDRTSIKLTVEDQGPGIPTELLPSLFVPFEPGPGSSGLGLGLYLARQCAVAHGGSLNLEPIPGRGARFVLTLPDHDEASLALPCGERGIAER